MKNSTDRHPKDEAGSFLSENRERLGWLSARQLSSPTMNGTGFYTLDLERWRDSGSDPGLTAKDLLIDRECERTRERLRGAPDLRSQVARALTYIRDHLFDPELDVATLRRQCGLRNHNLTTLFRIHLGHCIRGFIEQQRIETAKRLLRYEGLEVWRIGFALGFGSPETFCRAFRRCTGHTPSAYRRRLLC